MDEYMFIAGENMGLGSCFLGMALYYAESIIEEYNLPEKVLPLVQLVIGYPAKKIFEQLKKCGFDLSKEVKERNQ